ncbi:MAG: Amuc_1100 family pilus-like protein [Verrucomicrobiota bacterium]|nr:Amuc_1100 family pilus-like protein [Verrucomicrobiota bacterium]
MPWIKRHLFFVVLASVALVLSGVAGFFLFTKMKQNSQVREKLNAQVEELKSVYNNKPFPNPENLAAAQAEKKRVKAFIDNARTLFSPPPSFPKTNDRGFIELLNNTIAELKGEASKSGVTLPLQTAAPGTAAVTSSTLPAGPAQSQYAFTFSNQEDKLQFTPGSVEPWLEQLAEIKTICHILFEAKINTLESLQRAPVSKDDVGGADYLTLPALTNSLATFMPYSATFTAFSGELAAVLDGIMRSTNCIVVKNLDVKTSDAVLAILSSEIPVTVRRGVIYAPAPALAPRPAANSEFEARYGVGKGAPAVAPRPAPVFATPGTRAPTNLAPVTILAERPLRITLLLDFVKLKTVQK